MKLPMLVSRDRPQWRWLLLRWTVISGFLFSSLSCTTSMPGSSYSGPFQPLSEEEIFIRDRLKTHVLKLADEIGERNIRRYQGLEAAVHYIENVFVDLGYEVGRQQYQVGDATVVNLEAERTGTSTPGEIVLVGAHYDSVIGSPGANDNASGVAGLLEIPRLLARSKLRRTVRFVAFVNEEPPFFYTRDMGSRVYASRSRQRGENIVAMLALEMIGYYSEVALSQRYPFPFALLYPSTANFIGFVGNLSSCGLLRRAIGTFREATDFPSEGLAAPEWVIGVGWSDHWSFWQEGYPAIMVTDTGLFRYEDYHTPRDTSDRIDYNRLARVVLGLSRVVAEIAGNTKQSRGRFQHFHPPGRLMLPLES